MRPFSLSGIPAELHWKTPPLDWSVGPDGSLVITAGPETDWFFDPGGKPPRRDAPIALFRPMDGDFLLSARVVVGFASPFDAGALLVYERDDLWGKICFEFSPRHQPMVVSVVTRGLSDDCDSIPVDGNEVYVRLAKIGPAIAFHYSRDCRFWHLVRYFALGSMDDPQVGFLAQAPTGRSCAVRFSEISYQPGRLEERRSGR